MKQREITFRVWNGKEMTMPKYGQCKYFLSQAGEHLEDSDENGLDCEMNIGWSSKDDLIFMQYSGLKDTDGKEIYEDDIIEFLLNPDDPSEGTTKDVVIMGYAEYIIQNRQLPMKALLGCFGRLANRPDYKIKVIGNIYENPELLKS